MCVWWRTWGGITNSCNRVFRKELLCVLCTQSLIRVLLFAAPWDCGPPASSVHGISLARILEWLVSSSSKGSSWPRNQTHISWVSCPGRWILYHWGTWEAQVKYFHFPEEEMEAQRSKVICPGSTSENHSALKLHTAHWLPLSLFSHLTPESLRVSSASPAQLLPSLATRASDPWSAFILILRLNENINHT